jgi:hypothetical protein
VRALERRLTRLEVVSRTREEALVSPESLQKMAAECARVREKLLGGGPHVPAANRAPVDSEAARILRQKLLRDDLPPNAELVRE